MTKLNAKPSAGTPHSGLRRRALGAAITLALLGGFGSEARAFEFASDNGDWSGTLDTTISYGVSIRTEAPDPDLIGKVNLNPAVGLLPTSQQINEPGRFSVNSDDGDRNYSKGSIFSNAVKLTSELSLNYKENTGAFVRLSYFYDFENVDRNSLTPIAEDRAGTELDLLDAFVFHNFSVGEKEGSIRVGRQVVSWGESTFIQGGINVINPFDVGKLRVAGAELKDAFLPVDMLQGTFNVAENLSVEALYLTEFEQTEIDPLGTFFSTTDIASDGAEFAMLGFGRVDEPENFRRCQLGLIAPTDVVALTSCGAAFARTPTRFASETGQWGAAVHYFAPDLNDTEFGFFYLNYHSRLPIISGNAITTSSPASGRYFLEYPEDIHLWGASFNTMVNVIGLAVQGEISHRTNLPLQIDDVEVLFAGLTPLNAFLPSPALRFKSQLGEFAPGEEIRGFERHKVTQAQTTLTKVFGPENWLQADQLATVLEVGGTNVWTLPKKGILRFNGDGTDTGGGPDETSGDLRNPVTQTKGFADRFSWGYRFAARADYNNAFGSAFTVSPRVAFSHDVNGISPGPGGNFIENRKSATVGVETTYLSKWALDVAYTSFWGAGNRNLISDRDFVSFTARYSF